MERMKKEEAIGICQKLYEFFINKIILHAKKTVTLGRPASSKDQVNAGQHGEHDQVGGTSKVLSIGEKKVVRGRDMKEVRFDLQDRELKIERKGTKVSRNGSMGGEKIVEVEIEGSKSVETDVEDKVNRFLKEKKNLLISESRQKP